MDANILDVQKVMKKLLILAFFALFFMGCNGTNQRTSHYFGSSGIGYQYEIPGNYDFCGTDTQEYGFDMYCFRDMQTMNDCIYENGIQKEYEECNYDGHINVSIEPEIAPDGSINSLEVLMSKYPGESLAYKNIRRGNEDVPVVELSITEEVAKAKPGYLAVISFGKDYVAIIKGVVLQTEEKAEFQKAYEVIVKTLEGYGPRK
jgi:hypothetical protein